MTREYKTTEEIAELVRSFEGATVSRDDWKHREHLIVGLYYLTRHDLETATDRMRAGIRHLLVEGFGVDLTKEMPYHETITVFWMRTLASFNATSNGAPMTEKVGRLSERFDKDFPFRYYTRELLFSDEARRRFVEPDLQLFD
jgi:hypothetical protein